MTGRIRVEVTYALPERQWLLALDLDESATVADAIEASGIREQVPDLEVDPARVGIFGKKTTLDQPLRNGDRVELYRPLLIDPKEVRRARARAQRGEDS